MSMLNALNLVFLLYGEQRTLSQSLASFAVYVSKIIIHVFNMSCMSASNKKTSSVDRLKICATIPFCHDLGKTPSKTLQMIATSESSMSCALLFKWYRRFSEVQTLEEHEVYGRKRSMARR